MLVRELRQRPPAWNAYKTGRSRWLLPMHAVEWACDWTAYYLAHWAFLEVLEYLGIFSVLIAIIFYFSEAGDRKKQKHYPKDWTTLRQCSAASSHDWLD